MTLDPEKLAERFLTAFNAIDEYLRAETKLQDRRRSFREVLAAYRELHHGWRHQRDLRRYGELRNALVHEHYDPGKPLAVPTRRTTEDIERIHDAMLKPVRIESKFLGTVSTVRPTDTIKAVFEHIRRCDYSQFPVVSDGEFKRLITENGLTR